MSEPGAGVLPEPRALKPFLGITLVLGLGGAPSTTADTRVEGPDVPIRVLVIDLEDARDLDASGRGTPEGPTGDERVPGKEPGAAGTESSPPPSIARTVARLPGLSVEVERGAGPLSAEDVRGADAVLLGRITQEGDGRSLDEEDIRALLEAARSGTGIVATAEATRSLPGSRALGELLGREGLGPRSPDAERSVAVPKQSHPISQCVTHFVHAGPLDEVKLARGADVLSEALVPPEATGTSGSETGPAADPRRVPALWTLRLGRGRVVATTLDRRSGPSRALADRLLARAVQWSARRPVTVPLPGDFRTVAESLGPREQGLLTGGRAAKGFYRGRKIAPVMSYRGASWLVRPDRESTERPGEVLDSLGIRPGQDVADLGAGNGFFTLRLARRVGPEGKVYAVDIQKEMLELLERRLEKDSIGNVVSVLATESDPRLARDSLDLVLMVDVYHELAHPEDVIDHVRAALRDKGRLVLVEYRGEDPTVPIKPLHRMTVRQARAELEAVGFRLLEVKDFLPRQHILIFGKRDP